LKLVLILCGAPAPEMAARLGNYVDWFANAMPGSEWDVVSAFDAPWRAPNLGNYAGVLVSGSPSSVTQPVQWMHDVCDLVREADRRGKPVLGVCFGHQLIGHAYGARVVKNPRGWELGTTRVHITPDGRRDLLFKGLPEALDVNMTHEDAIDETTLGNQLAVLAHNDQTPVQAVAAGDHVRGVQFHPEVRALVSREYCLRRAPMVGECRAKELAQATVDTPEAERVLHNFMTEFVRKA
jgi:GMP synthase (glutamine-hydrolysing)